jgi:uncharacterized protein
MPNFVNRERELAALDRACGQRPGLAVVSGRRRVGKTALLDRFAQGRRAVFLPGTRAPVGEAVRRLEERVRAMGPPLPGDLLDLGHLDTWDAALGYLLARSRDEPLLLVLDEFPYLCEADPALPSTLQARWDHRGDARLSIVLAGSHVGLMEELVAADAPLFGRADAHLRLQPFAWPEAGLLAGGDDPEAWIEAYVTVGGMPRYLDLWDPRHDALANLADLLDGPGAPLGDEGTVVLQEVSPSSAAARVLELVALGAETFGGVRERSGLAPATVSEALVHLEGLGLLERLTPVGADPRRTKRVRYELRDPLLALWLSVVQPNREAFELGRGESVLLAHRDVVARVQQRTFARVARDWLGARADTPCGPWWPSGDGAGVDALALRREHAVAAAAVHWATGVDGDQARSRLAAALAACPHGRPDDLLVLARSGPGTTTPEDLFAPAGTALPGLH